ncbi:ROK family protein [Arthrobacter sp. Hiyo8]|nr:ROK family protein [Arthrobacter sp. Hiyo8]
MTERAKAGDSASRELLEEVGHWLGLGLANLAAALDPGTFVIGGGLCDAGSFLWALHGQHSPGTSPAAVSVPRLRSSLPHWDRGPG